MAAFTSKKLDFQIKEEAGTVKFRPLLLPQSPARSELNNNPSRHVMPGQMPGIAIAQHPGLVLGILLNHFPALVNGHKNIALALHPGSRQLFDNFIVSRFGCAHHGVTSPKGNLCTLSPIAQTNLTATMVKSREYWLAALRKRIALASELATGLCPGSFSDV